jgi:hypothetical protein
LRLSSAPNGISVRADHFSGSTRYSPPATGRRAVAFQTQPDHAQGAQRVVHRPDRLDPAAANRVARRRGDIASKCHLMQRRYPTSSLRPLPVGGGPASSRFHIMVCRPWRVVDRRMGSRKALHPGLTSYPQGRGSEERGDRHGRPHPASASESRMLQLQRSAASRGGERVPAFRHLRRMDEHPR